METLILTLDTIAVMMVIYFSYKGGKSPSQTELGPFRIRSLEASKPPAVTLKTVPKRGR